MLPDHESKTKQQYLLVTILIQKSLHPFHIQLHIIIQCIDLLGTEDGEDKTIQSNGGQNFILGTFGCVDKKLDAMGCLYISKKEYLKRSVFRYFMLRYLVKKNKKFKEEWDEKYKNLPSDFQFLWRTVNLSDAPFSQIIKYCYL